MNLHVNELMPYLIGKHHDEILKNFYGTCREVTINSLSHLWGIDHKGFCFSINITVKIVPILTDFNIMGLIHKFLILYILKPFIKIIYFLLQIQIEI